ncbi:hypothetical protein [Enterobacter bugandensis]|uniref:hypothetical protein n=1 Tax=Enterobacter bugandensis TaxID=881260 RepID=UPI002006C09C|nr:hypothetical protein [Enterobacter bugandensis]MCK6738307.1 hypothetical protein [Enterobacter bugandensis]
MANDDWKQMMEKGRSCKLSLSKHLSEIAKHLRWGISLERDALFFYYAVGVFIAIMVQVEENLPFGFKGDLFAEALLSYIVYSPFLVLLFMLLVVMSFRFILLKKYRGRLYRLSRLLTIKLWQLALPAIFVFCGVSTVCLFMWICFSLPHYKKYAIGFMMYVFYLLLFLFFGQLLCISRFFNKRDKNFKFLLIALVIVMFPLLITFKVGSESKTIKLDGVTHKKLMELSGDHPEEYIRMIINNNSMQN